MRKIIHIIIILSTATVLVAQSTTDTIKKWEIGTVTSLTVSQAHYKYWTTGGENTFGINGLFNLHLNYQHKRHSFRNNLDMGYGVQKIGEEEYRKTEDKLDLSFKYGYKTINKFYLTGLFSFKTQFYGGFEYDAKNEPTQISGYLAPAYLISSVGVDYLKNKYFSIYTSPLTEKITIVNNSFLNSQSAFGVDSAQIFRNELGAFLRLEYQKEAWENVTINSKLDLFSNYSHNPQNIDLNFNILVAMKVNKYLTVNITAELVYDDDIKILIDKDTGKKGPRLQVKETLGVGLLFNI